MHNSLSRYKLRAKLRAIAQNCTSGRVRIREASSPPRYVSNIMDFVLSAPEPSNSCCKSLSRIDKWGNVPGEFRWWLQWWPPDALPRSEWTRIKVCSPGKSGIPSRIWLMLTVRFSMRPCPLLVCWVLACAWNLATTAARKPDRLPLSGPI